MRCSCGSSDGLTCPALFSRSFRRARRAGRESCGCPILTTPLAQFSEARSSTHACSHRRQASAHSSQWRCMEACCPHSSAQALQAVRHASSIERVVSVSEPACRERILPVVAQISKQSRLVWMHVISSSAISSLIQTSAQPAHVCAQSKHAWMQAKSFALSRLSGPKAWACSIDRSCVM
jgi:hypothetical protein